MKYTALLLAGTVACATAAEWKKEASLPTPVYDSACAIVGKTIYLSGSTEPPKGTKGQSTFVAYGYDPKKGEWGNSTIGNPNNVALGQVAISDTNGTMYVFGGYTPMGNSGVGNKVQTYGKDQNGQYQWNANLAMNVKPLGSPSVGQVNNEFLVCGGYDDVARGTSSDCFIFNPQNNSWTNATKMDTPTHKACHGADGKMLYMAGGRTGNLAGTGISKTDDTLQMTDGETLETSKAKLPEPRSAMASVFSGGQLICMGGELANATADAKAGITENGTFTRVDVYDVDLDEWQQGPDLPVGLHSSCAVILDDLIYIIGGRTAAGGDKGTASAAVYSLPLKEVASGGGSSSSKSSKSSKTKTVVRDIAVVATAPVALAPGEEGTAVIADIAGAPSSGTRAVGALIGDVPAGAPGEAVAATAKKGTAIIIKPKKSSKGAASADKGASVEAPAMAPSESDAMAPGSSKTRDLGMAGAPGAAPEAANNTATSAGITAASLLVASMVALFA